MMNKNWMIITESKLCRACDLDKNCWIKFLHNYTNIKCEESTCPMKITSVPKKLVQDVVVVDKRNKRIITLIDEYEIYAGRKKKELAE